MNDGSHGFELCPWPAAWLDASFCVRLANRAFWEWWGDEPTNPLSLLSAFDVTSIQRALQGSRRWHGELMVRREGVGLTPIEATLTRNAEPDLADGTIWLHFRDLGGELAARDHLERIAYQDPVTRLPNRARLAENLGFALERSRQRHVGAVVLAIDLLGFRSVNSLFGHRQGDDVLRACGSRIESALPGNSSLYRSAANEFVAIIETSDTDRTRVNQDAYALAQTLLDRLGAPLVIAGRDHRLSAAIGIRVFPEGIESADDILRDVDISLQLAKKAGPGTAIQHHAALRDSAKFRHRLTQDLRHAARRGELVMYLQPQVDTQGRWCAAEALVRWQHPEFGLLMPDAFIPIAEESGLIREVDAWMLSQACRKIAETLKSGRPLDIAVNISQLLLGDDGFIETVLEDIARHGIPAHHLTLELTETVLYEGGERATTSLARISEAGVRISIDDFGTGYSNLRSLIRLQIDELKIDRSLISPLGREKKSEDLLDFMLRLANQLGAVVVAEGVETQQQVDILRQFGCSRLQGYFFSRPEPADAVVSRWQES